MDSNQHNHKVKDNNHNNKAKDNAENNAEININIKTSPTGEEAAVLLMITAHHLVVVVIRNTATPLLEVIRKDLHAGIGMDMIGTDVIGVNVIV
jgi:hypothetical protein